MSEVNTVHGTSAATAAQVNQYLTFALQGEEYGIEILRVQEIKGFSRITPIPNTPHYIKGVLNLRGTVVPVVDLRAKFAMPEAEYGKFTVIVVVTVGQRVVGLIVDAVSDVLDVAPNDIQPTPEMGAGVDTSFLTGLTKSGEKLIALLNIERLLGEEVMPAAEKAA